MVETSWLILIAGDSEDHYMEEDHVCVYRVRTADHWTSADMMI